MVNHFVAAIHAGTDVDGLASTFLSASHKSLMVASSLGNWPRFLIILHSGVQKKTWTPLEMIHSSTKGGIKEVTGRETSGALYLTIPMH